MRLLLPRRAAWLRDLHRWLGAYAGTDASQPLCVVTGIGVLAAVVLTITYRIRCRDTVHRERRSLPLPADTRV